MPAITSYRRYDKWLVGDQGERHIDIGSTCPEDRRLPVGLGLLRVGYRGSATLQAVDAYIKPADNGTEMGPIDVPFAIVVEEPVHVRLIPVAIPTAEIHVVLSVTPVAMPLQTDNATRTIAAVLGGIYVLPQWVRQVTAYAPATFQFRDRAGVAMSGALTGAYIRPDAAFDVLVGAAGTIVLSY